MSVVDESGVDFKHVSIGPVSVKIPGDWDLISLEDVAENSGEYGANAPAQPFDADEFRYIRITDLTEDGKLKNCTKQSIPIEGNEKYELQNGDLLFARTGAVGRSYLYSESVSEVRCAFAGYLIRYKLTGNIDSEYLRQYTNSEYFNKWVSSVSRSTTHANINASEYSSVDIPYPPLTEQRRIAEILSTVDELIQQTDAIIEAKQHLTQGFINVLVKTGVQDSPDTNKVQIGPKQVKIPTNWDLLRVDELVTDDDDAIRTGPFGSKLKKEYFVSEGVKVYEQSNVYNKDFTQGNRFVTQDRYESELTSYDANPGDVLITLQGTIGDAAVLPDNAEPGVINQKLMRVQVDSELCLPEYFATFFDESRLADFQIEAVSHGAVVSGLNISTISGIRVPIPSLQEQQRIIDVVESSKSSLDEEQETKQNLQELKRGLMQDLLTGEVRVPVET